MVSRKIIPSSIRMDGPVAYVCLDKGLEAVIDAADVSAVAGYRWVSTIHKVYGNSYAVRWEACGVVSMHRQLMQPMPGQQVDHADRNGLNNRRANMRFCTASQNQANRPAQKNNALGLKGVNQKRRRFQATIAFDGRKLYLGLFPTPEAAAAAYRDAAVALYGEFAHP